MSQSWNDANQLVSEIVDLQCAPDVLLLLPTGSPHLGVSPVLHQRLQTHVLADQLPDQGVLLVLLLDPLLLGVHDLLFAAVLQGLDPHRQAVVQRLPDVLLVVQMPPPANVLVLRLLSVVDSLLLLHALHLVDVHLLLSLVVRRVQRSVLALHPHSGRHVASLFRGVFDHQRLSERPHVWQQHHPGPDLQMEALSPVLPLADKPIPHDPVLSVARQLP